MAARKPKNHAATLLPDGQTVCLGCRKVWPCPDSTATTSVIPTGPEAGPADVLAAAISSQIPWPLVATQMGVDREVVQSYIDTSGEL